MWFFCHLPKKLDKYSKKLMNTETKTGIDAVKAASKRLI